jgi:hypothetical protein
MNAPLVPYFLAAHPGTWIAASQKFMTPGLRPPWRKRSRRA